MIVPRPSYPIRVLVVDDSPIDRAILRESLEAERDVVVVGEASDGTGALALARELAPDLITLDVHMRGLDGLATLERLMAEAPTPVLVVTDLPPEADRCLAFEATRRGALDLARKPSGRDQASGRSLRARARVLARVPVVRHLGRPLTLRLASRIPPTTPPPRIVGICASAGGPAALVTVLSQLPVGFPACISIAQHLPPGFTSSFARFLSSRIQLPVVVANRSIRLEPGTVVLPPDDGHLVALDRARLGRSDAHAPLGIHPSGDLLLRSIAEHYGNRGVGIVLSGIGADGAEGLLAIRERGGTTIAQDEATSVVFGMPAAARDRGAAMRILPLDSIASALVELAGAARR